MKLNPITDTNQACVVLISDNAASLILYCFYGAQSFIGVLMFNVAKKYVRDSLQY